MSNKKLLLLKDSELIKEVSLSGESFVIGRDDSSHLQVDDESVSRQHAKIIINDSGLYVENLSSTGQLYIDDQQVEFAEWNESQELKIGPYVLKWAEGEASEDLPTIDSNNEEHFEDENTSEGIQVESSDNGEAQDEWDFQANAEPEDEDQEPEVDFGSQESEQDEPDLDVSQISEEPDFSPAVIDEDSNEPSLSDTALNSDSTQIQDTTGVAILKVTQGEVVGREIKLDNGFQWIVGRSNKCHVKIDSEKLSRQHFKIVKVSGTYRVQDLGSSNGTRLNGVAISDAPLSPFDTLSAGPVELQFLIANAELENVPAVADAGFAHDIGGESTQYAPSPAVMGENTQQQFFASAAMGEANSAYESQEGSEQEEPKSKAKKVQAWWNDLPKGKRLAYVGAIALMLAVSLMPGEEAPVAVISNQGEDRAPASDIKQPAPESRSADISSEFYLLSDEERAKIENHYALADRARNSQDWAEAIKNAKIVLKFVDKYKDVAEIYAEAQTYHNDEILGKVSKNLKDTLDAKAQLKDQVDLLVQSGVSAIREERWTDAQEQCAKAVTLDPTNDEANKCYSAAYGRDPTFQVQKTEDIIVPTDQEQSARARLEEDLDFKNRTLQEAMTLEQDGEVSKALRSYLYLEDELNKEVEGLSVEGRFPASIKDDFKERNLSLKMQVEQRIKDIYFQYQTEFRTQIIDAEQLIANQDYVRARETYDRILNEAPNFEEIKDKRSVLYSKMISEARGIYHEALIYESVGDLQAAVDKFQQTKKLLAGIIHPTADEYFRKANLKLKGIVP